MGQVWNRRHFIAASAGAWAGSFTGGTLAAEGAYPSRSIQVITPIPPGGIVDTVARMVADSMGAALKQPLVVLNKPGGSYAIGVSAAAMAPADGYSMLTVHIGLLASQASMHHFDLFQTFTPIGMIGALPTTVTVGGKSRFRSIADLVGFGRANPGKVNFSTPGLGTVEHLKSVQFAKAAGFTATHIPYKGGPEMVMSLMNGEAHFSLLPNALAEPFVRKGQLRYIAPLSDERMPAHPDIPTAREQGVDIDPMVSWMGFMVRKGTPRAAIDTLSAETTRAMQSPRIREHFLALGALPTTTQHPEEFGARMRSDLAWMSRTVAELNLKLG